MGRRWNKKNRLYRDIFLFVILVLAFLIVSSFTLSGQTRTDHAESQSLIYQFDFKMTMMWQGITPPSLFIP